MKVWLCESEAYEESYIVCVADSLETAVQALKSCHGAPYKVQWEELVEEGGEAARIKGHFETVPGYSTQHCAHYRLWSMGVETADALAIA